MSRKMLLSLTALLIFALPLGCFQGLANVNAFPKELSSVSEALVKMAGDQGVLKNLTANVDGNVQDPGAEAYIQVTVASGVRTKGVNGEVDLRSDVAGTGLAPDVRQALIQELLDPRTTTERRDALLLILGPYTPRGPGS